MVASELKQLQDLASMLASVEENIPQLQALSEELPMLMRQFRQALDAVIHTSDSIGVRNERSAIRYSVSATSAKTLASAATDSTDVNELAFGGSFTSAHFSGKDLGWSLVSSPSTWNVSRGTFLSSSLGDALGRRRQFDATLMITCCLATCFMILGRSPISKSHTTTVVCDSHLVIFGFFYYLLYHRANKELFFCTITRFDAIGLIISSLGAQLPRSIITLYEMSKYGKDLRTYDLITHVLFYLTVIIPTAFSVATIDCFRIRRRYKVCMLGMSFVYFLCDYYWKGCLNIFTGSPFEETNSFQIPIAQLACAARGQRLVFVLRAFVSLLSGATFGFLRPVFVVSRHKRVSRSCQTDSIPDALLHDKCLHPNAFDSEPSNPECTELTWTI